MVGRHFRMRIGQSSSSLSLRLLPLSELVTLAERRQPIKNDAPLKSPDERTVQRERVLRERRDAFF